VTRLPDWEPRLAAYLASVRTRPHVYGENDCLLHVGRAVEAVTGADLYSEHVGRYHDARTAAKYLRSLGSRTPATYLAKLFSEKPVARAMRGDILIDDEGIPGICIGGEALMVGMGEKEGLVRVPRRKCVRCFAV
jgi:hypothetical protein